MPLRQSKLLFCKGICVKLQTNCLLILKSSDGVFACVREISPPTPSLEGEEGEKGVTKARGERGGREKRREGRKESKEETTLSFLSSSFPLLFHKKNLPFSRLPFSKEGREDEVRTKGEICTFLIRQLHSLSYSCDLKTLYRIWYFVNLFCKSPKYGNTAATAVLLYYNCYFYEHKCLLKGQFVSI